MAATWQLMYIRYFVFNCVQDQDVVDSYEINMRLIQQMCRQDIQIVVIDS
jgi:hypothetical protein